MKPKILDIAFASDPNDKSAWSGTNFKIYQSLCAIGDVDYLSCGTIKVGQTEFLFKCWRKLLRLLKLSNYTAAPTFTISFRDKIQKYLSNFTYEKYDYIYVATSSVITSAILKVLERKEHHAKVVFHTDATYSAIANYYNIGLGELHPRHLNEANEIGKHAFNGADYIILSSDWAKKHAIEDYVVDGSKIFVIPFGANIDDPDMGKMVKDYTHRRSYKFLFNGVDWLRKGGDVAVECVRILNEKGIETELHVVGASVPSKYSGLDFIHPHGFLNKNNPEEYIEFVCLMKSVDALLFPSHAECSAIALCEASGFGLPVFCYDTGGLANYVYEGVNGFRLPSSSTSVDFAAKIEECMREDKFAELNQGALRIYNEFLNWKSWTITVKNQVLV